MVCCNLKHQGFDVSPFSLSSPILHSLSPSLSPSHISLSFSLYHSLPPSSLSLPLAVPCPPKNLNLYRECSSNVIIFSWAATNNTAHYRAKAVDSEGENMDCMTLDTSCFFTNTVCGRRYTFTVYSVSSGCNSQASPPVAVRTGTTTDTLTGCF